MPYQDFRQFLDVLRQHGELIDVNRPIALNDVGKAMKQSYVPAGPAIMFNQNGTDYPLVAGVYSTRSKALLAFEADEDTIFDKVLNGLDNPIPPHDDVRRGAVPGRGHQRRRHRSAALADPDLQPEGRRPLHHAGHRGRRRIRRPACPTSAITAFSFSARTRCRSRRSRSTASARQLAKHKRMGTVPKAALVIGVDPILAYTCQVQVPDDTNDWSVAGGLRGAPVELATCKTCDVAVPATAEVVIEFEVDLNQTVLEGPLGEYTGYYTRPVAEAGRARHRDHPPHASRSSRGCSPASR